MYSAQTGFLKECRQEKSQHCRNLKKLKIKLNDSCKSDLGGLGVFQLKLYFFEHTIMIYVQNVCHVLTFSERFDHFLFLILVGGGGWSGDSRQYYVLKKINFKKIRALFIFTICG